MMTAVTVMKKRMTDHQHRKAKEKKKKATAIITKTSKKKKIEKHKLVGSFDNGNSDQGTSKTVKKRKVSRKRQSENED